MSTHTFKHTIDLGILGEHEAEITYDATRGYPETRWEPASDAEIEIISIVVTDLPAPGLTWDIAFLLSDEELDSLTTECGEDAYENAILAAEARYHSRRDAEDFV